MLAYAAERPLIGKRQSSPHTMLLIVSAHVALLAAAMSARMELPPRHANEPIKIFNNGNMWRDFTYVDDIVEGVIRTLDRPAAPNPEWDAERPECSTSYAPYRVYNIGNNRSVNLIEFVETLEKIVGKPAIRKLLPMQAGDVLETRADISALQRDVGPAVEKRQPLNDSLRFMRKIAVHFHVGFESLPASQTPG